jgi:hypothetical protein
MLDTWREPVVGRQRTLLLLLNLGLLGGATSGSGTTSTGSSGGTTGADVGEQVLDVLALKSLFNGIQSVIVVRHATEWWCSCVAVFDFVGGRKASYLGEQGSPDGLNLLDLRGLDQGLKLVGLQLRKQRVSDFGPCDVLRLVERYSLFAHRAAAGSFLSRAPLRIGRDSR